MPPTKLIELLERFRRRIKALSVATGLGNAAAAAAGLLLAAVLFDYVLNLPPVARIALLIGGLVALAVLAYDRVIRPAVARLTLSDVAGRLESAFPQFDDRLRSTVTFLTCPGDTGDGAPAMKQRVINEAAAMAGTIDVNRAIVYRPVVNAAAIAAGAVALLALLADTAPNYSRIALQRLFAPFSAPAWPKSVELALADALPQRVAVGQPLPVRVRLTKGDKASRQAVIRYQYFTTDAAGQPAADGPVREEFMNRGDDGVYTANLDARLAPTATAGLVRVSVESGDDLQQFGAVAIVPQLGIEQATATVTPPPYTNLKPATYRLTDGPATMVAGSHVALEASFNKPLAADADAAIEPLRAEQQPPQVAWERKGDASLLGSFSPTESLRFHLRATDLDGFRNCGSQEYELNVRPDQQPSVHVNEPRRSEERTAVATVPLRATAEDDFAVRTVAIRVERLGDKRTWDMKLIDAGAAVGGAGWDKADSAAGRVRMRLQYAWDLAKLENADLQPGDVLEYHLVVTDNYDVLGKQHEPVASGKLRITIISQDELATRINEEVRAAAAVVKDVRAAQARTGAETDQLADDTNDKPEFDPADKAAAERLSGQQATAAAQAKQAAGKFEQLRQRLDENKSTAQEQKDLTKDVAEQLSRTAEGPMRDAANNVNAAKDRRPDQKDDRQKDLADARQDQQKAEDDLNKTLERIGSTGNLSDAVENFRNLLQQQQKLSQQLAELGQQNLGKKPEQMTDEDRAKLEQLARDQKNLADKTDKAMEDAKKAADGMSKSDPASAQALKQAAETGQQQ
ncbi:MAG TPA: DUF4175 family protein, partial [Tepidisphaeraceae bacterium]|nr:DUF4175 family protein [Tepidisphaeraceae bacterium]